VEQTELCQVEERVFLVGPSEADEVVDDLDQADRSELAVSQLEERADVVGCGFAAQVRDHGVRVEDGHPQRRADVASARRPAFRAVELSGPRSAYLACRSAMPSCS